MISVIVAGAFITYILSRYMKGKENLTSLVIYSLISPYIQIGSAKYDSLYFACIFFLIGIVFKSRGKIRWRSTRWANRYYLLSFALICLYTVSWLVFSRTDFGTTLAYLLGIVKLAMIVFYAYCMNRGMTRERMTSAIFSAMKIITVVNTVACLIELSSMRWGFTIVSAFGSEETTSFLAAVTRWGFFARCFGLMETPMALGIVMLFAAAFFFLAPRKRRMEHYVYLAMTILCGALSASKTFWLGFAILMILSIFKERRTIKGYATRGMIVAAFLLVILFYRQIGDLIAKYLGSTYAYYWNFLSNPLDAFRTRYSSDSEFLGFMPAFLERYWLMGVGPSSIEGERAIDSAFVSLLHDGGIIALLLVVGFYISLLWESRKNRLTVVLIALLFCTGFGFQTWVSSRPTLFVMLYMLMALDLKKRPQALQQPEDAPGEPGEIPQQEPVLAE